LTKVKSGQIKPMTTRQQGRAGRRPDEPTAMDRHIPEALQAVVSKAMARSQADRYNRVEDLARDIDSYQRGFATKAENASAFRQAVLFVMRHKTASSMLAVFFVALAIFTFRLAASERTARANEQRALENEQRALANEQKARRETARALIAAAEAAEDAGDPETMREALLQVPEDLRDKTWNYIQKKSEDVHRKVTAPGEGSIVSISKFPGKPDAFLVAQSSGEISQLDPSTGQFTLLTKALEKGLNPFSAAMSPCGTTLALYWLTAGHKGNFITLARLAGGQWESDPTFGSIELPKESRVDLLMLNRWTILVLDKNRKLCAFRIDSGKLLWERNDVFNFSLGRDDRLINVLYNNKKLERLRVGDASLVSESQATSIRGQKPSLIHPDGHTEFSWLSSQSTIESHNLVTGGLRWQKRTFGKNPITPWASMAWNEENKLLGVLSQSSSKGAILELRHVDSGNIISTFKFQLSAYQPALACNRSFFATWFYREIYLWEWLTAPPAMEFLLGRGRPYFGFVDGSQKMLASLKGGFVLYDISDSKAVRKDLPIDKMPLCGEKIDTDIKGIRVIVVGDKQIAAYRREDNTIQQVWPDQPLKAPSRTFSLHPTEDLIWISNHTLAFSTGKELATLDFQKNGVADLVVLHGGPSKSGGWVGSEHLVTPVMLQTGDQQQKCLVLWNAKTGEAVARTPSPQVSALAASPDGQWIAEGGVDKRLRIRSGKNLELQTEFRAQDGLISGLVWHPRLPILATASGNSIRLWNTNTWELLEEIQLNNNTSKDPNLDIPGDEGHRLFVTVNGQISIFEPASFPKSP
jgi:WD40 repeat protein